MKYKGRIKNGVFDQYKKSFISKTVQDTAIVTIEDERKVDFKVTIF